MKDHHVGRRALVATAMAAALLASSITAVAVTFSDIGGGAYESQITNIANAGCASGFNDGTFRPQEGTKRGQFAYWLNNCGGRVAYARSGATLTFANSETVALTDSIRTGGVAGAGQTQFLRVTGTAEVGSTQQDFANFCDSLLECNIDVILYVNNPTATEVARHQASWVTGYSSPNEYETLTVDAVVQVPTDTTISYSLRVQGNNLNPSMGKVLDRSLVAEVIPFGATGGTSL